MLPQLTVDLDATGTRRRYIVPPIWKNLPWASNFENYPDQKHQVLENEYDWEFKDEKGVVFGYINHVEGSARLLREDKEVKRKTAPKPFTYYAFAQGAAYLNNHPEEIRKVRADQGLNGSFVVNFVNSIPINELFDPEQNDAESAKLIEKLKTKTHIIPVTYGALLARVYNATSGVHEDDFLNTEEREAKVMVCPNPKCNCAYELLSRNFWLPNHPEYEQKVAKSHDQREYRRERDITGDRPNE